MTKRMVEINGVTLEIDLSTATKIDEYKIGDNVKVLQKEYSGYEVYPGVIVDFVNFKELPTIQIAVLRNEYSGMELEFLNFNAKTSDIEITPCSKHELQLEKNSMLERFNHQIEQKQNQIDELITKRDWFVEYFNKYFDEVEEH